MRFYTVAPSIRSCVAFAQRLHTVMDLPSERLTGYNNLMRVLLQIGHVPRARNGTRHRECPLFDFAIISYLASI